ncbi:hypothetical protein [Streptomyces sp. RP5T]
MRSRAHRRARGRGRPDGRAAR